MSAIASSACTEDNCVSLKRYYAQLVRLTDKFPKLLKQGAGVQDTNVNFTDTELKFVW